MYLDDQDGSNEWLTRIKSNANIPAKVSLPILSSKLNPLYMHPLHLER